MPFETKLVRWFDKIVSGAIFIENLPRLVNRLTMPLNQSSEGMFKARLPDPLTPPELRQISHDNLSRFSLKLNFCNGGDEVFHCSKIVRCLPGKRIACIGEWRRKTVFAKFFIHSKCAKTHWQREERGNRALRQHEILTPKLILSGSFEADSVYFSFFEYIGAAKSFQDTWAASDEHERKTYRKMLAKLLARHHQAGIYQEDLHLDNFLLVGRDLYTVDGADINVASKPLNHTSALHNLCVCRSQFFPEEDANLEEFMLCYAEARGWDLTPKKLDRIHCSTVKQRRTRREQVLKKTRRECSAFSCVHIWNRFSVCRREYMSPEMQDILADPDRFVTPCNLLKNGATATVATIMADHRVLVIKRYNIKGWKQALSRAFRRTRAERSWGNAHRLRFYGIQTPRPVAIIEKRWGPIRKTSYFISEYCSSRSSQDFFLGFENNATRKQLTAEKVAALFKKLYDARISHGDLKATNLLISENNVSLIDLDAMKQHKFNFSFRRAWKKDISRFYENWLSSEWLTKAFKLEFRDRF